MAIFVRIPADPQKWRTYAYQSTLPGSETETVVFTTDWQDLFLSGTEVAKSCHRIDGSPTENMALLSTCLDGKIAMVAVKNDDTGKIVARGMLKVLWDPKSNKPMIFGAELYPDKLSKKYSDALTLAASQCAKDLNCTLCFSRHKDNPSPVVELVSLGGGCPWEHVNALQYEPIKDGKYTLSAQPYLN